MSHSKFYTRSLASYGITALKGNLLVYSGTNGTVAGNKRSLAKVLKSAEANILSSSNELKEIVIESGHMAESLMESVNDGYASLTVSKPQLLFI